jgi:hypothetical protein
MSSQHAIPHCSAYTTLHATTPNCPLQTQAQHTTSTQLPGPSTLSTPCSRCYSRSCPRLLTWKFPRPRICRLGSFAKLARQASSISRLLLCSRQRSVSPVSTESCLRQPLLTRGQPRRLSAWGTGDQQQQDTAAAGHSSSSSSSVNIRSMPKCALLRHKTRMQHTWHT